MKRDALKYLYASGRSIEQLARELYLTSNTLPMLVGVLDVATPQQVAEVIAEVMKRTSFAVTRQRAVTVHGLDVYLESVRYAHPESIAMVVTRKTDVDELARNLEDFEKFPEEARRP